MGKLKNSYEDIDYIPDVWLENATLVLDVGCGDGRTQVASRHSEWFKEMDKSGKYLGIDMDSFPEKVLENILYGVSIANIDGSPIYDCVLCINVLEHIPINLWNTVILNMRDCLKIGGLLIVNTPYKQGKKDYVHKYPPPKGHIVFDITEAMLQANMVGFELLDTQINRSNTFDGDGASLPWAVLRWVKRVITRNPYRKSGKSIMQLYRRIKE